jgi:tetratricopeptide (TPR) repeat protein
MRIADSFPVDLESKSSSGLRFPRFLKKAFEWFAPVFFSWHTPMARISFGTSGRLQHQVHFAIATCLFAMSLLCTGCHIAATGQNVQGVAKFNEGNYQGALADFQQAIAIDSANPDAFYNQASVYHKLAIQGQNQELVRNAEQLYGQCLELDRNHKEANRGLAVLYAETNRSENAFSLLKSWSQTSPENVDAKIELARFYEEFGDLETARLQLIDGLHLNQDNPTLLNALGHLNEKAGNYQQAALSYERSLAINRFQPRLAQHLGSIRQQLAGSIGVTGPDNTRWVSSGSTQR